MKKTARASMLVQSSRHALLAHGGPDESPAFVRYAYRPFDNRWLYWDADTKLLRDEKSRRLQAACVRGEHMAGLAEQGET